MYFKNFAITFFTVLLILSSPVFASNLLLNSGFEGGGISGVLPPTSYGYWRGDTVSVVGSSNGITPSEGSKMLHFLDTAPGYASINGVASQLFQIIDVSSYMDQIRTGSQTAVAEAYYNRVYGNPDTDTKFSVIIYAYQGSPASFPDQFLIDDHLSRSIGEIFSDGDIGTWEFASTSMPIPSTTDFLAIQIKPTENIYNDASRPEFDGHYADAISLTIIPEPTTLLLLGLGAVMLRRRR